MNRLPDWVVLLMLLISNAATYVIVERSTRFTVEQEYRLKEAAK